MKSSVPWFGVQRHNSIILVFSFAFSFALKSFSSSFVFLGSLTVNSWWLRSFRIIQIYTRDGESENC